MAYKIKKQITRICQVKDYINQQILLMGWIYNKRESKNILFLHIRDGSGFIQCTLIKNKINQNVFSIIKKLSQESAISIIGFVKKDNRAPFRKYEIQIENIKIIAESQPYPISKKKHGNNFLMNNRHLWLRSEKQHYILKIRASIIKIIRHYFDNKGFLLVDSPIFTANSCEETSTLFKTTWFNKKKAYLSQSGQLYQEAACMAVGKSYCFGPTFRAEKSKTRKHLNEFWMVEPEIAFMNLEQNIELAEEFLSHLVQTVIKIYKKELSEIFKRDLTILNKIKPPFKKINYTQAIKILQNISKRNKQKKYLNIKWGMDFGVPHETELTQIYNKPVIIYNFPSKIKAFYMKKNEKNKKISKSMDILAPEGYGEIIGGGERETDINILINEINKQKLNQKNFQWFLDLRLYGSVPHSGFGMGLERVITWICGLKHIREAIPFPRTLNRFSP